MKICFNKTDLTGDEERDRLGNIYSSAGYPVYFTSTYENRGAGSGRVLTEGKTTVLAGPSGVRKSSITNLLFPEAGMETGKISEKIQRGKHTTRHSELFAIGKDTYMMDTPGFSSMYLEELECGNLKGLFSLNLRLMRMTVSSGLRPCGRAGLRVSRRPCARGRSVRKPL